MAANNRTSRKYWNGSNFRNSPLKRIISLTSIHCLSIYIRKRVTCNSLQTNGEETLGFAFRLLPCHQTNTLFTLGHHKGPVEVQYWGLRLPHSTLSLVRAQTLAQQLGPSGGTQKSTLGFVLCMIEND